MFFVFLNKLNPREPATWTIVGVIIWPEQSMTEVMLSFQVLLSLIERFGLLSNSQTGSDQGDQLNHIQNLE